MPILPGWGGAVGRADGAADAARAGDAVPAYVSLRFERLCRQHGAAWVDDSLRSSETVLLDGLGPPLSPDAGGGTDNAACSGDGEPTEFEEWGESYGEEGMVAPDELTYDCAPPPAVVGCAPPPGAHRGRVLDGWLRRQTAGDL